MWHPLYCLTDCACDFILIKSRPRRSNCERAGSGRQRSRMAARGSSTAPLGALERLLPCLRPTSCWPAGKKRAVGVESGWSVRFQSCQWGMTYCYDNLGRQVAPPLMPMSFAELIANNRCQGASHMDTPACEPAERSYTATV